VNLNAKQIVAISIAVLSVMAGSAAQLTPIFGQGLTQILVAIATLGTTMLSSILAVITSQGSTVKDVLAMPGVQKIDINAAANQTLAAIAVDPNVNKIAPLPEAQAQVVQTAKGV
jgi:hypothetical protein